MGSPIRRKIQILTEALDLTQEDIGSIVGSSARTVARWNAGAASPQRGSKQRLLELAYVAEALRGVLRPEDANLWVFSPNPLLDHDSPAERIRSGDYRSVLALIEALADGIAV